ncbi:MAG: peptidoglycan-binding protein [Archangium gephyra]|uniref:Peptidoglycan-binding protein n=1 Tax=Archangium gephyra TaxID=48 RepID=A0A2W5T183_9BACT|nr:MAG: peptidoglycan-binding protein [Archangium gephyra]
MSTTYTIRSGDTLGAIAKRFNTTVAKLASANGISNPNVIYAGRTLTIPDSYSSTPAPSNNGGNSGVSQTYTVKSGDTLSGIASRYGTTVSALAAKNGIRNPNLIHVGQRLIISGGSSAPAPSAPTGGNGGSYRVRAGDTLSGIAGRYGTTVSALAQLNGISNPNLIYVGQTLRIPNGGSSQPSTPVGPVAPTNPGPTTGGISKAQLQAIMPNLSSAKADEYLPLLNAAMVQGGINTPKRQAAFLAQLAHESGQLRYFEEIASGAAYEGRRDLGNTQPGDGVRFKGRGPIQLTGRHNYRIAGQALGIDLENNPTLAARPDIGFRIAVWYWNSRNLNAQADAGNFDAITRAINGGYNGKADRDRYWATARSVLGA